MSTFSSISLALDTSSNNKDLKNIEIKSMMNIDHQQNQNEESNHFCEIVISTVMNVLPSSTHLNDQNCEYVYTFDHQQEMIIENINEQRQPTTTTRRNDFNEDENCQICGDISSGWHCGAITCEACKKFFLRSISTGDAKKKYKCQKDFSCLITKRSRTQCQYCRFQKCISLGMKPHESIGIKTEDLYKKFPCLVCGTSASGIHFGAITCEACKGFFRRSIKENGSEKYHCSENNNCLINSTSKITCRSCRFTKCIQIGMSIDASRIGRQSNLFKQRIRQFQNDSTSMATINDSTRIVSMAKKRKLKTKIERVFASNNEIDFKLSQNTKEFIEKVHNAYIMYLKDLPRCIPRQTIWLTMASQMIIYAQAVINFCQNTIPGFDNIHEKYEILSSCINSVIMITLFPRKTLIKYSYDNNQLLWNYWNCESTLSIELNSHVPQLTEAENAFRSFQSKLQNLQLDEKELSLLLLMIITRTNLNLINEENRSWPTCQYQCVQSFSDYTQARRLNNNGEQFSFDFYDIIFLVSQLRSLNRQISKCLMNIPWPYLQNLPPFFYQIYLPPITNMSSILNSNYHNLSFSSTLNNTNHYQNHLNSNFIDINNSTNNLSVPTNNETNFWRTPILEACSQPSWCASDVMINPRSCSSSSCSSSSNNVRFDNRTTTDDITVSIRW